MPKIYIYRTDFKLTGEISNFEEARAFLLEKNMAEHDERWGEDGILISQWWYWVDKSSGYIECQTTRELTPAESSAISANIAGGCSDGFGSCFEQQDFAMIDENAGEYISFDWHGNDYPLRLVDVVNV